VFELPAVTNPAGRIAQTRQFESSEITELLLSNGMRVAYKCTRFQGEDSHTPPLWLQPTPHETRLCRQAGAEPVPVSPLL
jgi:hypothetical protein